MLDGISFAQALKMLPTEFHIQHIVCYNLLSDTILQV